MGTPNNIDGSGNLFAELNEENLILFAAKHYTNIHCLGLSEFYEDVDRIKLIKKQVSQYVNGTDPNRYLNERRFLNNVICVFNVFEIDAAKAMLLFRHNTTLEHLSVIKTTMIFLGYMTCDELDFIPINTDIYRILDAL